LFVCDFLMILSMCNTFTCLLYFLAYFAPLKKITLPTPKSRHAVASCTIRSALMSSSSSAMSGFALADIWSEREYQRTLRRVTTGPITHNEGLEVFHSLIQTRLRIDNHLLRLIYHFRLKYLWSINTRITKNRHFVKITNSRRF
jgi:hypothetical protein